MADNIISFPEPPKEKMFMEQAYTTDGRQINIAPAVQTEKPKSTIGADFSKLVGTNVSIPTAGISEIVTEKKKIPRKKKSTTEEGSTTVENTAPTAANVSYADTYSDTNAMTYRIIDQADELLRDAKQDLDFIRSQRSMKGKYHYSNAILGTMSSLMTTKLAAIKEINSNIKVSNEMEYKRYKDFNAINAMDDNQAIMDAYSAFISAPVGAPKYQLPGTMALTSGMDDIITVDYSPNSQQIMDAGMNSYLSSLTPEESLMIRDNGNLEEVILYDEATGVKQFKWMDTSTGELLHDLPPSSNLTISDYTVDIKTNTARNTNLNSVKKVITTNSGSVMSKF
jgi:hypothetical protein